MSNKSDFEKLKAKWYAKAAKAGFEEIERNENDLKVGSSRLFIRHKYTKELWEAKEEYYRLAEHFLNEYKFENDLERIIWEYHTNAISAVNISKLLTKAKVSKLKDGAIKKTIKRLSDTMKRQYLANPRDKDGH